MDELTFTDADGVDVFARRWSPDGTPRAIVVIAHGLSEHSGRYARFADALAGAGYAVYAPDHRGHGRTAASTGVGRAAGGIDGILDDLHQLSGIAVAETGAVPVVLFGHSMGALVSQAYAERFGGELASLVLSGSPGANDDLGEMAAGMPRRGRRWDGRRAARDAGRGERGVRAGAHAVRLAQPRPCGSRRLRRRPDVRRRRAPTYGFLADLLDSTVGTMQPEAIATIPAHLPILLVTGERDVASNDAANVRELDPACVPRGSTSTPGTTPTRATSSSTRSTATR